MTDNSEIQAFESGYKEAQKEFLDKIDFYFHKCWISKKVPKLEELKQSLNQGEKDDMIREQIENYNEKHRLDWEDEVINERVEDGI